MYGDHRELHLLTHSVPTRLSSYLITQARNRASLPHSSLQQIQQSVQRTQALLTEAQNIAFDVQQVDQAFQTTYGNASISASDQELIAGSRERWQNTVDGLQDAMRVQAGVVGNIDTNRARSEEHTSALQSLMRISYAVFCLKTKKTTKV